MEDILYMVLDFRLIKGECIWKIYYTLTSLLKEVALNMSFGIRKDLDILYTNGGQNGPLPLILEIFCPETLFSNNIAIYHFL